MVDLVYVLVLVVLVPLESLLHVLCVFGVSFLSRPPSSSCPVLPLLLGVEVHLVLHSVVSLHLKSRNTLIKGKQTTDYR